MVLYSSHTLQLFPTSISIIREKNNSLEGDKIKISPMSSENTNQNRSLYPQTTSDFGKVFWLWLLWKKIYERM